MAEVLLDRYGVVTRGAVAAERVPGGYAAVYKVLAAAEDAGRVPQGLLRGGPGAAQFAGAGAVDRLRAPSPPRREATSSADRLHAQASRVADSADVRTLVLAAADPANPYGAAPWPAGRCREQPPARRKAGAPRGAGRR